MGQEESDLPSEKELEGGLTLTSYQNQQGGLSPLAATGKKHRGNKMFVFFLSQLLKQDIGWNIKQKQVVFVKEI